MTLQFGLAFDERVYAWLSGVDPEQSPSPLALGATGLLTWLEQHLGLGQYADYAFLRPEAYRQALGIHLHQNPDAFFAASLAADGLATATELLAWRDELIFAGWDFNFQAEMPSRLAALADVERILQQKQGGLTLQRGAADRWREVMEALPDAHLPLEAIVLQEPLELLPFWLQRCFTLLSDKRIRIAQAPIEPPTGESDLAVFQRHLSRVESAPMLPTSRPTPRADGTLIILRGERDTDLAEYFAQLMRLNPDFKPLLLISDKSRTLDNALMKEGLPSPGVLSASRARPALQLLKLLPALLWRPIEAAKLVELLTLPLKPFPSDLAYRLADVVAQAPGMRGERWNAVVKDYFEQPTAESNPTAEQTENLSRAQAQYRQWFTRRRFQQGRAVPREDVTEMFEQIAEWADSEQKKAKNKGLKSLHVLAQQARKVALLLRILPASETAVANIDIERMVRTVFEPSQIAFCEPQADHTAVAYHSAAVAGAPEDLVWWNFTHQQQVPMPAPWRKAEITYLNNQQVHLESTEKKAALHRWQKACALLRTTGRLILVIPETVCGKAAEADLLLCDIEATLGQLSPICVDLSRRQNLSFLQPLFTLPGYEKISTNPPSILRPWITNERIAQFLPDEEQSFTQLNDLFYYPYKWVFSHKLKLRKTPLRSLAPQNTLKGNLAHKLIELLFLQFKHQFADLDRPTISTWIDQNLPDLLEKEGSVFLQYGYEPDRLQFIRQVNRAAWVLVSNLQQNNWQPIGMEIKMEGIFADIQVKGRADLLLENATGQKAVVDLKWSNAKRRMDELKNLSDLQLVFYARFATGGSDWAHTAYFILDSPQMIARTPVAFPQARVLMKEADLVPIYQKIWGQMENTYRWRRAQLQEGKIEVRCTQTAAALDALEGLETGEALDRLEMRNEDAQFDDFRSLVGL